MLSTAIISQQSWVSTEREKKRTRKRTKQSMPRHFYFDNTLLVPMSNHLRNVYIGCFHHPIPFFVFSFHFVSCALCYCYHSHSLFKPKKPYNMLSSGTRSISVKGHRMSTPLFITLFWIGYFRVILFFVACSSAHFEKLSMCSTTLCLLSLLMITNKHRCKALRGGKKAHFDINTDSSVNIYNDTTVQNQ